MTSWTLWLRYCAALMTALGAHACGAAPASADAGIRSPRLRQLAEAVTAGDHSAVDAFWAEMKKNTTPLVEPLEGQQDHVWLTFVWKGDDATQNVILAAGIAAGHPCDNRLSRLRDTNVWYITMRMRNDLRTTYLFAPNDPLTVPDWNNAAAIKARAARLLRDPLNPRANYYASLVELDKAPQQPWIRRQPDVSRGSLQTEKLHSQILANDRQITVYRPSSYDPAAKPYPMLIAFDRESYTTVLPLPTILDNLIHFGKIPPVVAVLVGNPPDARNRELSCDSDFARFLAEELFPWVRQRNHVAVDPRQVVITGSSAGGLASIYFAFRHPELVGNVLSQSASLGWSPDDGFAEDDPSREREWIARQFANSPRKQIRFFLESGLLESVHIDHRHLRDVLTAKGYEITGYTEYNGAHDYLNWRGSIADGLIALWTTSQ
ncbi:MAG: DUF3327 domain-containing protein [Pirellulales bacterium]|nr:DUF3327 domain-containing protein [Pirellulales bacterium]